MLFHRANLNLFFSDPDYNNGFELLVFDRIKQTAYKAEENLIQKPYEIDFSLDGKTLITAADDQFMTIELFLDYPNRQIFSRSQDNLLSTISFDEPDTPCAQMEMSNDRGFLFTLHRESQYARHYNKFFAIWDVKDKSKPIMFDSYSSTLPILKVSFSKNHEIVYLLSIYDIYILNITNRSSIRLVKTFSPLSEGEKFVDFIASSDEKTAFLLMNKEKLQFVTFVNLSKPPETIESSVKLQLKAEIYYTKLPLKDDKTLLALDKDLTIYDISNFSSSIEIVSIPLNGANESGGSVKLHHLSSDSSALYVEISGQNQIYKLKMFDLTILASPQLTSEKSFPKRRQYVEGRSEFFLSPDLKSGFVLQVDSLLRLDFTNPKEMRISGIIPFPLSDKESSKSSWTIILPSFAISPDGKTTGWQVIICKTILILSHKVRRTSRQ